MAGKYFLSIPSLTILTISALCNSNRVLNIKESTTEYVNELEYQHNNPHMKRLNLHFVSTSPKPILLSILKPKSREGNIKIFVSIYIFFKLNFYFLIPALKHQHQQVSNQFE
jgi:hypothetical protein